PTKISQKISKQTQELLSNFYKFVIEFKIEKSFELCNILNIDETPVWFDIARNFTVKQKEAKTV
ncbi:8894_t:CDS:1, partial [Scutellospora calospora]